jgi:3-phytase
VTFYIRNCFSFASPLTLAVLLSSCASFESDAPKMTVGAGTPVPVSGETVPVATRGEDAADDPEIWADPADPSRALILGTDKNAGLYVYGLDGKVRQFLPEGPLNNVDLRDGFEVEDRRLALAGASDRGRMGMVLFLLDPASLQLRTWGHVPAPVSEPYGFCLGRRGEDFVAVMVGKDGDVRQYRIAAGADGQPQATEERSFRLSSQSEGCVVDDQTGALYIGEEAKGIWRYGLGPADTGAPVLLSPAPSEALKPDVEGLTLIRDAGGTWLIASSQGDSAFAVWRVDGPEPAYRGRFSGMAANGADNVTGTDGLAAISGPVGAFPEGLVVVQDDLDTDGAALTAPQRRQNFKLIDWREIKRALGL